MRKLNIMLMIRNMEFGGAQVVVNQLINGLDRDKYNVGLCILTREDNSLLDEPYKLPVKIHKLNKRSKFDLGLLFKLKRLLIYERTDIVHTHGWTADVWSRLAARMAKVPVIISHSHTNQPGIKRSLIFWNKIMAGFTDHFITVGEANRKVLTELIKIPPEKITIIRNVVDYERFNIKTDTAAKKRELGLEPDSKIISIIGRLHQAKGHEYFLEAAGIVTGRIPAVEFLIAGAGELEKDLRRKSRELGIEDKTHFLGGRKDIPEILAVTDVYVSSSLFEGLPLTLLEAMAAGKAIAATDIEGCRELIANGQSGFLTPPEDVRSQADIIIKLLENSDLRRQLGENARSIVQRGYTLKEMLKQIDALYQIQGHQ